MLPLKRELKIALVVLLGSLFFSAKAQAGVTFGAKVIVQDAGGSLADFPSVAVDISGNIYVVWQDTRGGVGDIYFAKSTDGGATFNPNVRVNDADTDSAQFEPDMAVDTNGNIYVVWTDTRNGYCDTYFAKSTDGGATFSPNVRVNDTSSPTGGNYSKIAVDTNGNIYVVWADGRNGNLDIYFAKSTDGGATFSPNVRVDDTGALNKTQYLPCLALDSQGNIYVAWKDERSGHHDIYFAKSTDGGATFSPNVRVNFVGSDGHWPAIAVDNHGNIFVAWQDSSSSSGIYLAKSVDGGISFGTNVKVNDGPMGSTVNSPSMVVDRNGAVYIVWEDNRDRQLSGGSDIYFARSRNGGASFETNIHVDETSLSTPYQTLADISIDNNANIYVVWQESRIYSVKGIQTDSSQPLPYLQNFSTDPGWATNNAANFSWNQQEGNYSAKSIIGSGEYAIVETDYNGGDFRIEFDLKITNRDTDSQTIFGLFGPTYTGYQTSPYDKPCLYVSVGGSEKKFKLVGITDTGNYYSSESQANALKTNTWYRLSLLYDSANKRIGLKVREKGKEPWENWVCGPEVSNLVGSFPLEMKYLGFSMVGEWATSGPMQEALIDNLKFVLTGGISGKATREDGITPIANVDFNLNTYTDFSSYYDRFWSQSLADGTYYISCLEAGDYRMDAQPPYGFGPEYYNNTESWSGASPVHVETGVTTPNIDFTLPLGGEIRGHVYAKDGITPVAGENISLQKADDIDYSFGANTDSSGAYFRRVAFGNYKIKAGGFTDFGLEFYNNKNSLEDADVVSVLPSQDASGIDFILDYGGSLMGLVLNKNLEKLSSVRTHCGFENMHYGKYTYTDILGKFFFSGLPNVLLDDINARPEVSSGLSWAGVWPGNRLSNLGGSQNFKNYPLIAQDGALATGYIKDTAGNPMSRAECWISSKNIDIWGETDSAGRYEVRLPLGRHFINFDNEDYSNYAALSQEITITDTSIPVALPDLTCYDNTNGASISGSVINSGEFPKHDKFSVGVFKSGTEMNADTMYGLSPIQWLEDIDTPTSFTLGSLPPTAQSPNPRYLVFLAISKGGGYPEYVSVRHYLDNVNAPASGLRLLYLSPGGTIAGKVVDAGGKPVLGTQVVFIRQQDNRFFGFADSDENGEFALYNFQPGIFNAIATHPRFTNNSTPLPVVVRPYHQTNLKPIVFTSSDDSGMRQGYLEFEQAVASENVSAAMEKISDNYLDNGYTKASTQGWFQDLFNENYNLTLKHDITSIDFTTDKALVKCNYTYTGTRNADNQAFKDVYQDELHYFKKENGNWRLYGNQELFDYEVEVAYFPYNQQYMLHLGTGSKAVNIASVTVSGPDIASTSLYDDGQHGDDGSGDGNFANQVQLGTQPPSVGGEYTFNISDTSGNVYTRRFVVKHLMRNATSLVSPANSVTLGGRPVFSWEEAPNAWGYYIEIFRGSGWPMPEVWAGDVFGARNTQVLFNADGRAWEELQNGQTYSWRVQAVDPDGNWSSTDTRTFTYNNHAPLLAVIGDKSTNEKQKLEFNISATDEDADILEYSASGLPQGATFEAGSRTFSWTPDYNQPSGPYAVTFNVSDGALSDSETVSITVNNLKDTSGRITNVIGQPIPEVTIAITNGQGTVISDSAGYYNKLNLPNGTYTLTPTKANYTFSPASRTVVVNGSDNLNLNFTATARLYTISGFVRNSSNEPVSGVKMTVKDKTNSGVTNVNGYYEIPGLGLVNSLFYKYIVKPTKSGFAFDPPFARVPLRSGSVTNVNFTMLAGYNVSGYVRNQNNQPISGAVLYARDGTDAVSTDSNGFYTLRDFANGSYFININKPNYLFEPFAHTVEVNGSHITEINFTGLPAYYISGTVKDNFNRPLSYVNINISNGQGSVYTDRWGKFRVFVPKGTYTLTPTQNRYIFSPASTTLTVNGADVTNVNFTGTRG